MVSLVWKLPPLLCLWIFYPDGEASATITMIRSSPIPMCELRLSIDGFKKIKLVWHLEYIAVGSQPRSNTLMNLGAAVMAKFLPEKHLKNCWLRRYLLSLSRTNILLNESNAQHYGVMDSFIFLPLKESFALNTYNGSLDLKLWSLINLNDCNPWYICEVKSVMRTMCIMSILGSFQLASIPTNIN